MGSVALRGCAAVLAAAFSYIPAHASTPLPLWQNVARLHVLCLAEAPAAGICHLARDVAAGGAPIPVDIIEPGDPAVLASDSITLLIHVSVEGRLAALSVRPYRNDGQAGQLFGAAPRAALIAPGEGGAAALARPLRAALAETLPWLAAPQGPRPIRP